MKDLIEETIESMMHYIPKVIESCSTISNLLYKDKEQEALELLSLIINGLEWITSAVNGINKFGNTIDINIEELNQYLIDIELAVNNRDFVFVADLFKYEVEPILILWLEKTTLYKQ